MTNLVKEERIKIEMTQQELANTLGVSRQTINSIEVGRYVPSITLALKISHLFKKSVNELFKLEKGD
jgi:putative transcriptional regulator